MMVDSIIQVVLIAVLCLACIFVGWCIGIVWCWREDLKVEDYNDMEDDDDREVEAGQMSGSEG